LTRGANSGVAPDAFTSVPVVRQPIVDRQKELFAYDLRFASDPDVISLDGDPEQAWVWIRGEGTDPIDLLALAGGAKVFLQITPPLMLAEAYSALPGEKIILEVTKITDPTDELVAACRKAKDAGFTIALDGMSCDDGSQPLTQTADMLSFDFFGARKAGRRFADGRFADLEVKLHARKLITNDVFDEAMAMGFDCFEGPFLSRPQITPGIRIPPNKINHLRFIEQINRPEIDFDALEQIVRQDVALSVNLLKLINSPSCGLGHRVESIKQALVLLGERPLKRWATLTMVRQISEDKPSELMKIGLSRARFCELAGVKAGMTEHAMDLFMLGLVSVLDAMLGCSLQEVLDHLPSILEDVKEALLGSDTPYGKLYQLVTSYERGDHTRLAEATETFGLSSDKVMDCYCQAIQWADRCLATDE